MPKENIWNIPNLLTMLRMALIGVFVWIFREGQYGWAIAVFLAASATDILDGYIARKYHLITDFGKLMDPLADKLMLITALICLATAGWVPLWAVLVMIVKELIMVVGGTLLLKRGIVVSARLWGKIATALFILAVVSAFFHDQIAPWNSVLLYLAVAASVYALFWYTVNAIRQVQKKK